MPDREYQDRSPKQRDLILALLQLRGAKGATNAELSQIAMRFGGRLLEIRKMGHEVRVQSEGRGLFRYWLVVPKKEAQQLPLEMHS